MLWEAFYAVAGFRTIRAEVALCDLDFLTISRSQGLSDAGPACKRVANKGELAPFLAFHYDSFRKGIKQVSKATSTEAFLTADPEVTGQLHQRRTLESFVGPPTP